MTASRLPFLLLCLFLALTCACRKDRPVPPPDAMFRGDAARTGRGAPNGPLSLTSVKWVVRCGGRLFSSPVISNGVLYAGCDDSCLYAVDAATGQGLWRFRTLAPLRSTPAVSGGLVCFTGGDGSFYALSAADGNPVWEFATRGEHPYSRGGLFGLTGRDTVLADPWDFFHSSPAVSAGAVYFGSGDGSLYALDLASGQEIWRFQTGDAVHGSPAVSEGKVFIGGYDTYLYALEAASGKEIWRFATGEDTAGALMRGIQGSPAVDRGAVYFGSRDGHVYALEAESGKLLWSYSTLPSWVVGSPALTDSLVLVGTSDSGKFLGLDRATGNLRFEFDARMFVFSSPAVTKDAVYFGSFNGRVYALGLPSGEKLWEFASAGARSDPNDVLLADGGLNRAAITPSGLPPYQDMLLLLDKLFSAGAVLASPLVTAEAVYFGATDSCLYAIH